jgi:predicted transcriptional regulator
VEKGYLAMEKVGPVCLYRPVVRRREAVAEAIDEFVDVVLDRALDPLVAHLARAERLSDDDRRALERILARVDEEGPEEPRDDGPR